MASPRKKRRRTQKARRKATRQSKRARRPRSQTPTPRDRSRSRPGRPARIARKATRRAAGRRPATRRGVTGGRATAKLRVSLAASLLRRGRSLQQALRAAHTTIETVRRHAPGLLQKTPQGRYRARPRDPSRTPMKLPTARGWVAVSVRSRRTRRLIGRYWAAAKHALATGDESRLAAFHGRFIAVGRTRYPFVTDLAELERLAHAGELPYEDIYEPR